MWSRCFSCPESYSIFMGSNISFSFTICNCRMESLKKTRDFCHQTRFCEPHPVAGHAPFGDGIIKRMDAIDFLHMQLRLEGKRVVGADSLRQVEVVPHEEMLLMVIASFSNHEQAVYYDEALSSDLHGKLGRQVRSLNFPAIDPIVDTLKSQGLDLKVGHFKTYIFPDHYKDLGYDEVVRYFRTDPKVHAFGFDGFAEQVHAVERDGRIVSACVSARENEFCGEAWVYTDKNYRHQGLAQRVVGAWSKSLLSIGKIPFYSHRIDNLASAQLAKCLELESVFEEITISYMNV